MATYRVVWQWLLKQQIAQYLVAVLGHFVLLFFSVGESKVRRENVMSWRMAR